MSWISKQIQYKKNTVNCLTYGKQKRFLHSTKQLFIIGEMFMGCLLKFFIILISYCLQEKTSILYLQILVLIQHFQPKYQFFFNLCYMFQSSEHVCIESSQEDLNCETLVPSKLNSTVKLNSAKFKVKREGQDSKESQNAHSIPKMILTDVL